MASMNIYASYLLFIQILFLTSQSVVPPSETFKIGNYGEFSEYLGEYRSNYRGTGLSNDIFRLCWYNTTDNAYTLAMRMGYKSEGIRLRWVWEANRGNPVKDNATLTFGTDGNLVLADADGRVVWQTGTTNKGVVGFKILPNGNMVLYDNKDNFLWQSFDSATDTLLVGQFLRLGGATKLVSRASAENNSDGSYTFVLEKKGLGLYYKSPNTPKPLLYFSYRFDIGDNTVVNFTLTADVYINEYILTSFYFDIGLTSSETTGLTWAETYYNSTFSYLRLGMDGSLKLYTYNPFLAWMGWKETHSLFSRSRGDDVSYGSEETECQLPSRCGNFGLCEDNQCVACPLPSGLMGWSKSCEPVKVPSCKPSDFKYYKVEGVHNIVSKYTKGDGPVKVEACESKCSKDCKCMGYFYHKDTSRCWVDYDLKTLTKVDNSAHLGYIKMPK